MTDKERLEEIHKFYKERLSELLPHTTYYIEKLKEEIKNLERRLEEQIESNWELDKINQMYTRKSERYREALEFYADEEIYKENLITKAEYDADGICISNDEYAPPIIYFDRGEKARQALKGDLKWKE